MHAGQAQADRHRGQRRRRNAGLGERLADRVADVVPGAGDAVRQARRAAVRLRQFGAAGVCQPYAGAGSAAVDADKVFDH